MANEDDDIPASGAVFTFGKSRFADNTANKFWIRNDKAVQVNCGDDHSALVTENGRLYVFGANDWGQLGLGHTKSSNKPSSVKGLKQAGVVQIACGRSHTLALTRDCRLHSFGAGGDGQLGHGDSKQYETPKLIEALGEQEYLMLSCGTDHSAALTKTGTLYTWGGGSEGQLGHGEVDEVDIPRELSVGVPVRLVSCGYYHTALTTEDKRLFTFGEGEGGKLGLGNDSLDGIREPEHVTFFKEPVEYVSCGNAHTAVITESGHLYTFGDGASGQLGLGPDALQTSLPVLVTRLEWTKCRWVACGESHTAVVTAKGCLYTFGDGRHGKLAQGEESFSNIFVPTKVHRFKGFVVEQVSCGGCHTLVRARRRNPPEDPDSDQEPTESEPSKAGDSISSAVMGANLAKLANSIDLNGSLGGTARVRRRQREGSPLPPLSRTLPPLGSSTPKSALSSLPSKDVPLSLRPLGKNGIPKMKLKLNEDDETDGSREGRDSPDGGGRKSKRTDDDSAVEDDDEDDDDKERKVPEGQDPFGTTHFSKSGRREGMKPLVMVRSKKQPIEEVKQAEDTKKTDAASLDRRKESEKVKEQKSDEKEDSGEEDEDEDDDDDDDDDEEEDDDSESEDDPPPKKGLSLTALAGPRTTTKVTVSKRTSEKVKKADDDDDDDEESDVKNNKSASKDSKLKTSAPIAKMETKASSSKVPTKKAKDEEEEEEEEDEEEEDDSGEEDEEENEKKGSSSAKAVPKKGSKERPSTSQKQSEDDEDDDEDDDDDEDEESEKKKEAAKKPSESKTEKEEPEPKAWQFWKKKKNPDSPAGSTISPTASTTSTSSTKKPGDQGGSKTCVIL